MALGEAAGGNVRRARGRWLPAGVRQAAGEAAPRDPGLDEGGAGKRHPVHFGWSPNRCILAAGSRSNGPRLHRGGW